jgi:hypothetical protein
MHGQVEQNVGPDITSALRPGFSSRGAVDPGLPLIFVRDPDGNVLEFNELLTG